MRQQPLRRRPVVEIAIVFQLPRQPVRSLRQRQGQLELRRPRAQRQLLRRHPRQRRHRLRLVLQHQHHLEQRAALQRAHRLQLLHQLLERQRLMRERPQRRLAHLRQQTAHALVAREPRAQHQRVDEEADQALDLVPRPVRHRRPQQDVRLPAPAPQHQRQRRLQHHEQRHPLAPREIAQRHDHAALQPQRRPLAAAAARPARPVRRQRQRLGRRRQRGAPVLEVARRRVMPALPQRVIGILDRQRQEAGLAPLQRRGVERRQLLQQDRRRPAVERDVVHHHRQHMQLGAEPQQARGDRQVQREIEALPRQRLKPRRQGRLAHLLLAERKPLGRLDRLHRHPVHHREGGAQRLVARHHRLQRQPQRRRVQRPRQPQRHRHGVARAALQLLQEPQALLRERQRQRGRTRPRPQRLARGRAGARHHPGKTHQARMLEHAAQRQLDPEPAAHPRHQPRRQQRMAAEIEEIVVAADAGDAEQLRPQRRQQLLHRALRRLVAFGLAPHRLGQRAPVELAARRARQRVEPDIALRQHMRRQPCGEMEAQRRRRDLRLARHHIGHQALAPHHHRRLRHRAVLQQRRLDLAGLDAQAPQLHLAVRAAEELHHPVAPPAPEIPRPVEPPAGGAERVRHEPLRRQPRTPDIAPRQTDPAEMDLPRNPHRNRLQAVVQDVDAVVRQRRADRQPAAGLLGGGDMARGVDGRLGGPIEVGDLRHLEGAADALQQRRREHLAAEHEMLEPQARRRAVEHAGEEGRHAIEQLHLLIDDQRPEGRGARPAPPRRRSPPARHGPAAPRSARPRDRTPDWPAAHSRSPGRRRSAGPG